MSNVIVTKKGYNYLYGEDNGPLPPCFSTTEDTGPLPPSFSNSEERTHFHVSPFTLYQPTVSKSASGPTCLINWVRSPIMPWTSKPLLETRTRFEISTSATMRDLMNKIFSTNIITGLNVIVEIVELGDNRYSDGMKFFGDNASRMSMTLASIGWNEKRTGVIGEMPGIWIWSSDRGLN